MKNFFRRTRRDLARFVLGFDRCPCCYRRNFWAELKMAVEIMVMGAIGAGLMVWFLLLA